MKKKRHINGIILTIIIVLAASPIAYYFFSIQDPVITGYETFQKLPREKHVIFTVRNNRPIKSVTVSVVQGLRHVTVIEDRNVGKEKKYDVLLQPRHFAIEDGKATVFIDARSGYFSDKEITVHSTVDTVPPVIEQVASTPFVRQGSSGAVKARVIGAKNVYVKMGSREFPLSGSCNGKTDVYCTLFPVPLSAKAGTELVVVADDGNDNYRTVRLDTAIGTRKFAQSKINVTDKFIEGHVVPLLGKADSGLSEVEAFRKVNDTWRRKDNDDISEVGRHSEGSRLWEGRFLQLRGSRVFARFGDRRDYYYQGKEIGISRHLGYDLASYRHAPVTAANNGIVVYVGDLQIYGHAVIIDHGLGLMSLYGHMSKTSVKAGEHVAKGQVIGRTGNTGLALGDHLHFGMYVHGVAVNPIDWWDPHWIRIKIMRVLSS